MSYEFDIITTMIQNIDTNSEMEGHLISNYLEAISTVNKLIEIHDNFSSNSKQRIVALMLLPKAEEEKQIAFKELSEHISHQDEYKSLLREIVKGK